MLGQTLWPPAASTLALVPAVLLCADKLLVGSFSRAWWCALAGVVALQVFAGFPQYVVYGSLLAVPVVVLRAFETGAAWRRLVLVAAAVVTGFGLAAVQLVPSLELAREGLRAAAPTAADLHYLTIWDPYTSAEVLAAAFDPAPSLIAFHLGNSGGYLGMATLLLAAVALVLAWRSPWTWLWLAIAIVSLVLSNGMLGASAPLYRLFAELPLVGGFRTPERLRFITFFALIALAVQGFDALRDADGRWSRLVVLVVALAWAAGMIAVGAGAASWRVALAAALVVALVWPGLAARPRQVAELALFAFIVLDVVLATARYGPLRALPLELSNRFMTADRRESLPAGLFEQERDALGPARIALPGYRPRMATAPSNGGYRVACYEPLVPSGWPALDKVLTGKPSLGATLFDLDPVEHATFYDVAGVQRILGREVIENPDALPRAYLSASYRVVSQDEAFAQLRDGAVDFQRQVLLERAPGFPTLSQAPIQAAEITGYAPERVVVEVVSPGPALLVLSDSYHPGWRATVDGQPVEILRANGLYRAVEISEGSHEVVFEYVPGRLRLGGVLSLASFGVLVGVWFTAGGRD